MTLPVSSRAAKTPAQRVIELEQKLAAQDERIAALRGQVRQLELAGERWTTMRSASFGGVGMAQLPVDLLLWEAILNSNPEIRGIIEIGTWQGGFSGWLWAQSQIRDIEFSTFDAIEPAILSRPLVPWREDFGRADVFAAPEIIGSEIEFIGEPLVVLCDGGNKPRELRTFAPMLNDPRSLIAVHDWKTETLPSDVPETLEEMYGEQCDDAGSMTRWFRVRA